MGKKQKNKSFFSCLVTVDSWRSICRHFVFICSDTTLHWWSLRSTTVCGDDRWPLQGPEVSAELTPVVPVSLCLRSEALMETVVFQPEVGPIPSYRCTTAMYFSATPHLLIYYRFFVFLCTFSAVKLRNNHNKEKQNKFQRDGCGNVWEWDVSYQYLKL